MPFEVVKVKNSKELWEFRFNDFFRLLDLFRTSRICGGRDRDRDRDRAARDPARIPIGNDSLLEPPRCINGYLKT